jgi:choline-glycine betaine transporter
MPSATLFNCAKLTLQNIEVKQLSNLRTPGQPEAIVAVVFSAFTLEAFINEIGDYASNVVRRPQNTDPPVIGWLGSLSKN